MSSQWATSAGPRQKEPEEEVSNYLSKPNLVRLYMKERVFSVHVPSEGICRSESQAALHKEARSRAPLWEVAGGWGVEAA